MAVSKNNFKGNPNPVDPDVKVPDAVRRAAEAANAAMQSNAPPEPPPTDPNTPPANDTIKIVEADPPKKLPGQVTPVVVEPAPPAPEPTPPTSPQPQPDDTSWEARYNSMHGQWKRANKLNEQLQSRIEALEHMLSTPASAPQPSAEVPAPAPSKLITDKELEELGPEMIDIMRRAARETAGPEIDGLKHQITVLEAKLNGTSQTLAVDARSRMLQDLTKALPEWKTINHHPDFHAWLALPDAFTGVTRKKLLTDAYEGNKTPQVLAFFESFVSELAATQPPEPQPDTVREPAPPSKPSLEALASPGRARAAASPTPAAEKQIIYTSDINAFYAAKRKGLYNGREAEFDAAEKELQMAMREGRVVQNT